MTSQFHKVLHTAHISYSSVQKSFADLDQSGYNIFCLRANLGRKILSRIHRLFSLLLLGAVFFAVFSCDELKSSFAESARSQEKVVEELSHNQSALRTAIQDEA